MAGFMTRTKKKSDINEFSYLLVSRKEHISRANICLWVGAFKRTSSVPCVTGYFIFSFDGLYINNPGGPEV